MNNILLIILLGFVLASCGGSGSGSGVPGGVPSGSIGGVAHDNILRGSTITVYHYGNGQVGAVLGTATTKQDGTYSLNIQTESPYLLLVASGGKYTEEASLVEVTLSSTQKLRAVVPYTTGGALSVSLTPYTNLAAGLAANRIARGSSVAMAVTSANAEISNLLGFNIVTTTPRDITNPANITPYTSDEYSYGFISGAISSLTKFMSEQSGQINRNMHTNINSISFAEKMYQDVIADGLLDGVGKDGNGAAINLALGITPLSNTIYRYGLAAHVLNIAKNLNGNKTSLTAAELLPFANQYALDAGPVWGDVTAAPFNNGVPVITFSSLTANQWLGGTAVPVTATISSPGSIISAVLSVDGVPTGVTPTTPARPLFTVNLKVLANGTPVTDGVHALKLDVVDSFGITHSMSQFVRVDNTAPVTSFANTWCGVASDVNGSGIRSVKNLSIGVTETVNAATGAWCTTPSHIPLWPGAFTQKALVQLQDNAGNCSAYSGSLFADTFIGNYSPLAWTYQGVTACY